MKRRLAGSLLLLAAIAGCGAGASQENSGGKELEVLYRVDVTWPHLEKMLGNAKKQYEAAHPGVTIQLTAVQGTPEAYYTKLALLNRSPDSAPDLYYHDTFQVNADVAAGKLAPLDEHLATWPDWDTQFPDSVKAAARGTDGRIYGVPISTDTRGLWYQKEVFAKAGLAVPWQPKTWDDVLTAARTIKQRVPGVVPFSMYSTKIHGEATTMQGFEMLLYGTPGGTLYDDTQQKWVAGGRNFTDALAFVNTIYREELGPRQADAQNPKLADKVNMDWFPAAKLGISLDGAWTAAAWKPTSTKPWPEWTDKIGWAAMPTQNGQEPGSVSMSGGWVMAMSAYTPHKKEAFDFITVATNKENSMAYSVGTGDLAPRRDVAADPAYSADNPSVQFFTELAAVTHYRPAYEAYPKVSAQIQEAMEAITTGSRTPEEATAAYARSLPAAVGGADKVLGP
ncbi:multiple sugar transport system substrate-binding protein [Nonomuraea maritima]|uniref:Multiple sugar transport system substrate-binding protein n=1 Tax=Nonomuraea maritima TaxID=683260 RepID=A0A1G8XLI5_9ACTN|nr:extracellular solute-binding protein [Nonomuraea maritima]SDJ91014.1 multiple sugar transport system substrate-binding protein [Nonomuraea maritima]